LETRLCARAARDIWLRDGSPLWTEKGGVRILSHVDVVARSTHRLVCPQDPGELQRRVSDCQPTAHFRSGGGSLCLRHAIDVRAVTLARAATGGRRGRACPRLSCDAPVRDGTA